jgi:hypothetical protein
VVGSIVTVRRLVRTQAVLLHRHGSAFGIEENLLFGVHRCKLAQPHQPKALAPQSYLQKRETGPARSHGNTGILRR